MNSSMYRDYVEEQLKNRFVHEFDHGFITYNIADDICQLEEIYIKPSERRKGIASSIYTLMGVVAKKKGCNYLKGSIVIGTNNSENSMMCLLKNDFKLAYTEGIIIYFLKHIGG